MDEFTYKKFKVRFEDGWIKIYDAEGALQGSYQTEVERPEKLVRGAKSFIDQFTFKGVL